MLLWIHVIFEVIERKTLLKVSKTSYPAQLHCEEYNDKSPYCFELGDISVSVHLGAKSPGCAIISSNVKGPLNEPYVLIPCNSIWWKRITTLPVYISTMVCEDVFTNEFNDLSNFYRLHLKQRDCKRHFLWNSMPYLIKQNGMCNQCTVT